MSGNWRVGGLTAELERLTEVLDFQFKWRSELELRKLRITRGVLVSGPPGTGKTTLCMSAVSSLGIEARLYNAAEFFDRFVGGGEGALRDLFSAADNDKRSAIIIDEIDAVAAARASNNEEFGRRLANQLLPLLDGMNANRNAVVIGITNRPQAIDAAFRRPGRFDEEISIKVPSTKSQLKQIYAVHLDPFQDCNVDLDAVADRSSGYVGADIEYVIRKSTLRNLKLQQTSRISTSDVVETIASTTPSLQRHFQGRLAHPSRVPDKALQKASPVLVYVRMDSANTPLRSALVSFADVFGVPFVHLAGKDAVDREALRDRVIQCDSYFGSFGLFVELGREADEIAARDMFDLCARFLSENCIAMVFCIPVSVDVSRWQAIGGIEYTINHTRGE